MSSPLTSKALNPARPAQGQGRAEARCPCRPRASSLSVQRDTLMTCSLTYIYSRRPIPSYVPWELESSGTPGTISSGPCQ